MNINLTKLYVDGLINIDEDIQMDVFDNKIGIIDLQNLHLKGKVEYLETEDIILDLVLSGSIIMQDAMTLENASFDFETNIDEEMSTDEIDLNKYIDKTKNILDISEILWQNIVLEVPIRVKKDTNDVSLSGEGWQLNKEEIEEIDPRLAPLQELFKDGKE